MKPSLRHVSFAMFQIKQCLQVLKEHFRGWVPQQSPMLVPVPISAKRRTRQSGRRHSIHGD